jgi:adenylosuccinate lyase
VAVARELREGKIHKNDLVDRLAGDARLRLNRASIEAVLLKASELTGSAGSQVDGFVAAAAAWAVRVPESAGVKPGRIL